MPDYEKLICAWNDTARQLRAFWVEDSGTSIHLLAADSLIEAAEAISTLLKERDDARRERDNAVANCVSAVKWLQDLGVDFSAATSA
jgi:hypothetical protein